MNNQGLPVQRTEKPIKTEMLHIFYTIYTAEVQHCYLTQIRQYYFSYSKSVFRSPSKLRIPDHFEQFMIEMHTTVCTDDVDSKVTKKYQFWWHFKNPSETKPVT